VSYISVMAHASLVFHAFMNSQSPSDQKMDKNSLI
jgi:hypothetical protein